MTPFEEFLFYDGRNMHSPGDSITRFRFSGSFDAPAFERAFATALRLTPLARSLATWHENGIVDWRISPSDSLWAKTPLPPEIYEYREEPHQEERTIKGIIDITTHPGVRMRVFHDPQRKVADVYYQFNHVTTDGLGAMLFFEKILRLYQRQNAEEEPTPREIKARSRIPMDTALARTIAKWYATGALRFLNPFSTPLLYSFAHTSAPESARKVRSFAATEPPVLVSAEGACVLQTCRRNFSPEETSHLLRLAKASGGTLNDYLLARAFFVLAQTAAGGFAPCRKIRAALPFNMRQRGALAGKFDDVTLANVVSVLFLEQKITRNVSFESTLKRVQRTTSRLKTSKEPELFSRKLRGLCDVQLGSHRRWGMEKFTSRSKPFATFLFSNLGRLLSSSSLLGADGRIRAGELALEEVKIYPPRTTNVPFTLALLSYSGALQLALTYDSSRVKHDLARKWLDIMFDESISP
ncbi:MAG: hypothetical protein Q4D38_13920 [Planctomycetia bacterium]|nr:hypothetical protein [Planctomycetia bacterium]